VNTTGESNSPGQGAFKYELLLLLVSLIWGSAFVAQQIGMEKGLGPMTFNGLRFVLGCLSLIPVIIWRKKNLALADGEAKLPYICELAHHELPRPQSASPTGAHNFEVNITTLASISKCRWDKKLRMAECKKSLRLNPPGGCG